MILLKSNQLNKIVVTLTQNTTVCDPEYLFQFIHIFSKKEVDFILPDVSPHPTRYNQFEFVEGQGVGQIPFPYEGQYNYYVYAQPFGSGNLNPLLATELVENGIAEFIVVSADTTNENYFEFISDDEFNSNTIFAPDEINPVTPSNTPGLSPTPTPSITASPTPTNTSTTTQTPTPTNTSTPTPTPTSGLSPTPTPTNTETPTNTPTPTPTNTETPTPTNTETPTNTPTPTNTETPTNTPTPTNTETPTQTPSPTNTETPTQTPTPTNTGTPTQTPTPSSTPPPFSPSSLTNLQHWYLSTSGASVSSWTNYGLLGGSVSQGTASRQPSISTETLGSYTGQSVYFASRDNMSGTFTSANYSSSTVFAVMKIFSTDASGWSIDLLSGANNSWSWQSRLSANTSIVRKDPNSSSSPFRTIAPLLLGTSGTTGSLFTASFNDVLGTSGAYTSAATTAVTLNFGYDPGLSSSTQISIFEFLVYNRVLTTIEYANVMSYLKTKYQYNTW
jgi:hypothetical protein